MKHDLVRQEGYEKEDSENPVNYGPLEQLARQVVEKWGKG